MKYIIYILGLFPIFSYSQFHMQTEQPPRWSEAETFQYPTTHLTADKGKIAQIIQEEKNVYQTAIAIETNVSSGDMTLTKIMADGSKLYQYMIKSDGALGMRIGFTDITASSRGKIWIYNQDKTEFVGPYLLEDIANKKQTLSSIVHGSQMIISYLEPATSSSSFQIRRVDHFFRGLKSGAGFRTSQSCMINVACVEGNPYNSELMATCRILVTGNAGSGWCTGTLMNNTSENADPLILTANHCSKDSDFGDLNDWEFHFFYHSTTCSTPFSEPEYYKFTGCTALSYSGQDYGNGSSDFLMLRLKSALPDLRSRGVDFTLMGWDRSNTAPTNGVSIHHPDGDIKKISTFSSNAWITGYNNPNLNTHLGLIWSATGPGRHSSTQGGSSGSGLLNQNKLLVGSLTGGASSCNDLSEPDFYGRLALHWNAYGNANNLRVDRYLDPNNTGAMTIRTIKLENATVSIQQASIEKPIITSDATAVYVYWNNRSYQVTIYDATGKVIQTNQSIGREARINTSSLSTGIYFITLSDTEHTTTLKLKL